MDWEPGNNKTTGFGRRRLREIGTSQKTVQLAIQPAGLIESGAPNRKTCNGVNLATEKPRKITPNHASADPF